MSSALLSVILVVLLGELTDEANGIIQGVVVNGSRGGEPIPNAEVHLRAGAGDLLETVATAQTDHYGKFIFKDLSVGSDIVYLPGVNLSGVHYPGRRVHLNTRDRITHVKIVAYEAQTSHSPLVATNHRVEIEGKDGVLVVTEALQISNPSVYTYVGEPLNGKQPVTLCLSIPPSFDRVTFDREFYGRRFWIADQRLVTDIPWAPGNAELRFTYRIPRNASGGAFRRSLDLPSSVVSIRVSGIDAESIVCNLPQTSSNHEGITFEALGGELPAGYVLELQIGEAPMPWTWYARCTTLMTMAVLVGVTLWIHRHRSQPRNARDATRSREQLKTPVRAA